jgi:hypothetical protein
MKKETFGSLFLCHREGRTPAWFYGEGPWDAFHLTHILAKKRHLPCRFASKRRKTLAAFLALPLPTGLKAP